jgi:hypothetical protein
MTGTRTGHSNEPLPTGGSGPASGLVNTDRPDACAVVDDRVFVVRC